MMAVNKPQLLMVFHPVAPEPVAAGNDIAEEFVIVDGAVPPAAGVPHAPDVVTRV